MKLTAHWSIGGRLYCEDREAKHTEGRHGDKVHQCVACFSPRATPALHARLLTEAHEQGTGR